MKHILKKVTGKESGNAIVLVALAMGGMIAMLGLVIDGGQLYVTKSHLQKAANAAALSGAQEILNDQTAVNQVVDEVLDYHGEKTSLLLPLDVNTENNYLQVVLQKDVPIFFSSLFGVDHLPIKVHAKAGLNPMGEAIGAVPLGIDESVVLNYGQTYSLKVDAGESSAGNFGVLALEKPGAKPYETSLTYGYDEALKVGEIINTQTGNIAGGTRRGVNTRIDNCPYSFEEIHHRDCSRVMLVLVYKPSSQSTNQMKSVEITGFAYFYVTERMGNNDDSIKGIFIERAGAGTTDTASTLNRGAYAIKLME